MVLFHTDNIKYHSPLSGCSIAFAISNHSRLSGCSITITIITSIHIIVLLTTHIFYYFIPSQRTNPNCLRCLSSPDASIATEREVARLGEEACQLRSRNWNGSGYVVSARAIICLSTPKPALNATAAITDAKIVLGSSRRLGRIFELCEIHILHNLYTSLTYIGIRCHSL
jgi:hypothetical protein